MRWSPFGNDAVACGGRFLGAWIEAVTPGPLAGRLEWDKHAMPRVVAWGVAHIAHVGRGADCADGRKACHPGRVGSAVEQPLS